VTRNAIQLPEDYASLLKLQPLVGEMGSAEKLAQLVGKIGAYRIRKSLPEELKGQLPSPEQITALLEGIE